MIRCVWLCGLALLLALGNAAFIGQCCQKLSQNASSCCYQDTNNATACCAIKQQSASQAQHVVQSQCHCHVPLYAPQQQHSDLQLDDYQDLVIERLSFQVHYEAAAPARIASNALSLHLQQPPGELYYLYQVLLI